MMGEKYPICKDCPDLACGSIRPCDKDKIESAEAIMVDAIASLRKSPSNAGNIALAGRMQKWMENNRGV